MKSDDEIIKQDPSTSSPEDVKIKPETLCPDSPDKYLKVFFPFDPYHLPRSGKYLQGLYQHWGGGKPSEKEETHEVVSTAVCVKEVSVVFLIFYQGVYHINELQ